MDISWGLSFVYLFIMAPATMPTFHESDSSLFIVLHWSVCLVLYQWYLSWLFATLKLVSAFGTLLFFLQFSLGFVHLYTEHQLCLTTFCVNTVGILIKIVTINARTYLNMLGKWELLLYWFFYIDLEFLEAFLKNFTSLFLKFIYIFVRMSNYICGVFCY